jgi:tetratricopeptide (TPR) repeat protein
MQNVRGRPGRALSDGRPLLVAVFALAACATTGAPGPGRIAELESEVRTSADPSIRVELASAYLQANRAADALAILEPLVTTGGDPAVPFYLGLAYEQSDRFADARREYARALEAGLTGGMQRRVRNRLALLGRRELEHAVRTALAQEQSLSTTPSPRTVGVFPFLTVASDELQPLGRALAELLSTDLGLTDRLTVLERARVQLFLDELRLAQTGVTDEQTAARAGRVLGAGRIIQGRLEGSEASLTVQAAVVPVGTPPDPQAAPLRQQGSLDALFDLQTNLTLDLYRALGVELTVAERERVARRPTQNVQALLAFGAGLEAEDALRYAEAVQRYDRALELDPGFQEAQEARDRAQAAAEAAADPPQELAADMELDLAFGLPDWLRRRRRFAGVDEMIPNPETRDPISEILGLEGIERRRVIDLVVRRPGGSE